MGLIVFTMHIVYYYFLPQCSVSGSPDMFTPYFPFQPGIADDSPLSAAWIWSLRTMFRGYGGSSCPISALQRSGNLLGSGSSGCLQQFW
jgi:hypothetical protein